MIRTLALSLALVAVVPLAATAHGPTRQKLTKSIEINAPAEKVWKVIGNFQDMSWHPAIEKTEGSGGNDVGAKRKLTLKGGATIEESLTKYDAAGRMLGYEITNVDVKVLPVTNYSSSLMVSEDGGKATVTWKGAFYRGFMNNDPPPELSDEAAVKAVTGIYDSGLEAIKKKAEAGS